MFCLTDNQLKQVPLELTYLDNYHLGAGYCRQDLRKGGIRISNQGDLKYFKVKINELCKEQHIEACAIKTESSFSSICIIAIYRAPSADFNVFMDGLDSIIKKIYKI
jgi:hypothetical protein